MMSSTTDHEITKLKMAMKSGTTQQSFAFANNESENGFTP